MHEALVTIAIPAYKSAYLCAAIHSALEQDYQNIELLIVDDCSPEDIKGVVDRFSDTRIRYIRNDVNLGKVSVVHNWNKCLAEARGDYFVLLCDDDLLQPNMVSSMLELPKAYPECGIFHVNRSILRKSGELFVDTKWAQEESYSEFIERKFEGKRKHTISEFFYRTEFLRKEKYTVFPVGFYSDDVTIFKLCQLQGKMISSQEPMVVFRESDIHITGSDKYAEGKVRAFVQYYHFMQSQSQLKDRISHKGYECTISQYLTHCNKKEIVKLLPLLPKSSEMLKTVLFLLLKH